MTNPKAPWPRRTQPGGDMQSGREAFVRRLRQLGAAPDVLADVEATWDDEDAASVRLRLVGLSDEAIRNELLAIEAEWQHGHQTVEEEAQARHEALVEYAVAIVAESIPVVLEWVRLGADAYEVRERAAAALEAERARRGRRTLLAPLEEMAHAS